MSFFSELKRRNVFRVALLFMVASWLIMQVADVGISLLGLPVWTGRFVFLMLLIAFPLVMLFSWAYEITPEGLKKEKEVDRDESVTHETAKKLDTAVIVLLIIGIGGLLLDRFLPEQAVVNDGSAPAIADTGAAPERSIAVLPFVNMSTDDENEYFSDGLSEELLNLLAKIPELQVAARTSAFRFKESDLGIGEIAEQLNVAHVLEGSVRKSGDEIRITAQLIKASDGYHLWSDTWDRQLIDVFAIQDEIAAAVVDQLRISLLGEMPKTRVTDPDAYALYLQAREVARQFTQDALDESISLLTRALAIDPEYAEAWAELARAHSNMTGQGFVSADDGYSRAQAAAERALAIDPKHARAMSTMGWLAMYWEWDFPKAARLIGQARAHEPGNASILNAYGVFTLAFAKTDSAIAVYEEGLSVDPFSVSLLVNLAGVYMNASRFEESERVLARLQVIAPGSRGYHFMAGWLEHRRHNAEAALAHFAHVTGPLSEAGKSVSYYDLGDDAASERLLEELKSLPHAEVSAALVHAYRGETDDAFEWLDKAYEVRDGSLVEIRMYVYFDSLHNDPRWDELIARIGMTDEVAEQIGL